MRRDQTGLRRTPRHDPPRCAASADVRRAVSFSDTLANCALSARVQNKTAGEIDMLGRIALVFIASIIAGSASAADPIKIGVVNMLTGPFAEGGSFQVNGLQLALEDINKSGGILGRPVELRTEDNQSTNPGTVLAFSKLFTDPAIKAIVGPIASTQIQAASPAI